MHRSLLVLSKDIRFYKIHICCLAIIVFASACSPIIGLQKESKTIYSIIFVIHGDGDYLYHDTNDNEVNADEETLIKAKKAAIENPNAEVFIFHQKARKNFLFFFPQKDGEFYYYRNGQLIANESYWRDSEKSSFDNEAGYYRRFHLANQNSINMFLYFGHEIPEFGGAGYDASYPDRTFTLDDLVSGMHNLTSDSLIFDLTVLSTCYGGTPYTIAKLAPFSQMIIASPENLHLSYFDFSLLERLDVNLKDGDVHSFAKKLAQQSFDILTKNIQTEVSVVIYDVKKAEHYFNFVQNIYKITLDSLKELTNTDLQKIKRRDCGDIPVYQIPAIKEGVDVLYRPPLFGRSKNKQTHSGWECFKY